jgi:hypothetical protein
MAVMGHEIGHGMGLAHVARGYTALMRLEIGDGDPGFKTPRSADISGINTHY